jgi:hypothetical protein
VDGPGRRDKKFHACGEAVLLAYIFIVDFADECATKEDNIFFVPALCFLKLGN